MLIISKQTLLNKLEHNKRKGIEISTELMAYRPTRKGHRNVWWFPYHKRQHYRTISLVSHATKNITSIILQRIEKQAKEF